MKKEQLRIAEELLFAEKKAPSFAKMLYFGLLDTKDLLPFPTVPEDEQQQSEEFLRNLESFLDTTLDPIAIDRNAEIPAEAIEGLGKLGALGLTIPKEYGGRGMSQYTYCKTAEAISRRCGATALFVNAHQSIGLKALLLFGTEEQKKRWLPRLARGEDLAAFALTEPNAGSDASGVETRAEYLQESNLYRINGRKQWITNGGIAKVLTVMAQTEVDTPEGRQDKITAFLVTSDMPGFQVAVEALEKVGMRGSKTAILDFVNLEVPSENILGTLGGGLKMCLTVLDYGRVTFGATCTGAAKKLLQDAIDHAKNRYQFHRPIGSFSLVKKKIAEMSALVYAMDAATYLTAGLVDRHTEDFMLEAAMLKVFTSDSLWSILYDTMQIFGGRSFFTDDPYERMMRDARLNMIGEGSNEVMRAFIGAVGMRDIGLYLKTAVESVRSPLTHYKSLWKFAQHWGGKIRAPVFPLQNQQLSVEADSLGKAIRSFGFSIVRLLRKYREGIVERQLELDRIATAAMSIYTMTAVIAKADNDLTKVGGDSTKLGNDLAISKLYCKMALDRIKQSLNGILDNNDAEIERLSDQVTGIIYQ